MDGVGKNSTEANLGHNVSRYDVLYSYKLK